ncbi:hypothetical protein MAPG_10835 [Magnaporthiopsis poae ATCC 64411]|uniref:G domain-containing protein n=1 Tax=Magnaporthiopsis poae (strain ATCC 64411 / 73-15) TaxID=644358 RepID=A0A0C4EDN0_MAGP6|nr:hypothetical protein MAPG_10835 [Magnaporthiopsis poae ATCC 64411]
MQLAACLRTSLASSRRRTTLLFQTSPLYPCPAVRFASAGHRRPLVYGQHRCRDLLTQARLLQPGLEVRRAYSLEATARQDPELDAKLQRAREALSGLPPQCTGCGGLTQTSTPGRPGYYNPERKDVKLCSGLETPPPRVPTRHEKEDSIVAAALRAVDPEKLENLGVNVTALKSDLPSHEPEQQPDRAPPLCDRCHNLVHHSEGTPIFHPSLEALRETIDESPYKYNHIYHIIDAADFPMSLLPNIHSLLEAMPLRSQNRRSRSGRFYGDRKMDISFIITRSDLLARKKEQVDGMMSNIRETLREALGRRGRRVRLGNVHCVSARCGWWTQELLRKIRRLGGGCWFVGKANVGKSRLFHAVFPKGMGQPQPNNHQITVSPDANLQGRELERSAVAELLPFAEEDEMEELDEYSLLPPARRETNFPEMPLVSALPGTTASPIRVPFGNGKGELIDLPGLRRSRLDEYVKPEHHRSMIMQKHIRPTKEVIAPGKSLLIGGFIRITPELPWYNVLSWSFVPLKVHITSTRKAVALQQQTGEVNVENIATKKAAEATRLAGTYALRWDVTKEYTGPLTAKAAGNIPVDRLPFRILGADIVIEGVGWIELTVQVRKMQLEREAKKRPKRHDRDEIRQTLDLSEPGDEEIWKDEHDDVPEEQDDDDEAWPKVQVYTPEGGFVSVRPPMKASLCCQPRKPDKGRPRKSMKGAKKRAKAARRAAVDN